MDSPRTAALVGATGGAGTTRLCLDVGSALAAAGRDVLVFDLALDTQGLARHVDADLAVDATTLLTDPDAPLADAVHDHALDAPGRLALAPAHAPFVRTAAAKTPEAAARLDDRLVEAARAGFDHVVFDTPPVASNPAVAAVTTADRVGLVFPGTPRGADASARARGRLADVGSGADVLVATRTTETGSADADVTLPDAPDAPVCAPVTAPGSSLADAAITVAEGVFDTSLGLADASTGRFDAVRRRLP